MPLTEIAFPHLNNGSKETLLEILHELDQISFSMGANNISISPKIDENHNKSLTQAQTELSSILVRNSL